MNHLFIVGAQRSGSTYLYHLLNTHPQVCMAQPVRPEPKFFLNEQFCSRGRQFYEQMYFAGVPHHTRWLGEKSTSYIESTAAARRIREFYPGAQILLILRDPVERAWSNYRFSVKNGLEQLDFEVALAAEPERLSRIEPGTSVNPFAYRRRGYYIEYLESYCQVFPADQINVVIFEELVANLANVQALYRGLGLDDTFDPPCLQEVINSGENAKALPRQAFLDLARGYEESVEKLEHRLGRRLDFWRRHWEAL